MISFSKSSFLKLLFISLGAITSVIFIANYLDEDIAILVGNSSYIPIQIAMLITAIYVVRYFGMDGVHGIGWIAFLGFVICWFAGDMSWIILEMVFGLDPYPSIADVFYLPGYPFLMIFVVSYIIPFRDAISKKMMMLSVLASLLLVTVSIIMMGIPNYEFDTALTLAYPIFDGVILVPVLLGLFLFLKSKTDLMWSLILFGILSTFIGDIAFAYMEYAEIYYTGNPLELAFFWSYILITFGMMYHVKTMSSLGTKYSTHD